MAKLNWAKGFQGAGAGVSRGLQWAQILQQFEDRKREKEMRGEMSNVLKGTIDKAIKGPDKLPMEAPNIFSGVGAGPMSAMPAVTESSLMSDPKFLQTAMANLAQVQAKYDPMSALQSMFGVKKMATEQETTQRREAALDGLHTTILETAEKFKNAGDVKDTYFARLRALDNMVSVKKIEPEEGQKMMDKILDDFADDQKALSVAYSMAGGRDSAKVVEVLEGQISNERNMAQRAESLAKAYRTGGTDFFTGKIMAVNPQKADELERRAATHFAKAADFQQQLVAMFPQIKPYQSREEPEPQQPETPKSYADTLSKEQPQAAAQQIFRRGKIAEPPQAQTRQDPFAAVQQTMGGGGAPAQSTGTMSRTVSDADQKAIEFVNDPANANHPARQGIIDQLKRKGLM